jgi:hypothetical protein
MVVAGMTKIGRAEGRMVDAVERICMIAMLNKKSGNARF